MERISGNDVVISSCHLRRQDAPREAVIRLQLCVMYSGASIYGLCMICWPVSYEALAVLIQDAQLMQASYCSMGLVLLNLCCSLGALLGLP